MNSKHGHKKKPTLVRQNTFSLDKHETGASRKLEGLSRVGIAAILDRADKICNLSPDVREYLASHLTMMMEETERLIRENDQLRDEISLGNSNSDKKIKTFQKQLEKERAKSKILLSRVKEDPTAAGSEDVILIANHHRAPQNESEVTTEVTQLSVPPRKDKKHNRRHSRSGRSGKKSASLASSLPSSLSSEDIQMKKMSQEFWSINQSAEIEKTRLSELVTLLSGQLSSAEEAGSEAELKLREEIQKCARLELSLERAQLGNSNCTGGRHHLERHHHNHRA